MKKFLIKSLLFIAPFLLLLPLMFFYSKNQGDLIRVGFISEDNHYRDTFQSEFDRPLLYDTWSTLKSGKKTSYTVLVIGDSFSTQGSYGFQNYLEALDSISVLYLDLNKYGNSIETLYAVLNDGLLDCMEFRYVVLESVERDFVKRGQELNKRIRISDLPQSSPNPGKVSHDLSFPPPELLKFPLHSLLYLINDHAYISEVYKVKTSRPLFSGRRSSELLFHKFDLKHIPLNNNVEAVSNLNNELNILSTLLQKSNIKLMVLPCPDKYDMYYDYIVKKEKYPKPMFFELMKQMYKNYVYIDSKDLLDRLIQERKDVYFYDDTHWSPWASQRIAREISSRILLKN